MDPRFKSLVVQVWAKGIYSCLPKKDQAWINDEPAVLELVKLTLYFPVWFFRIAKRWRLFWWQDQKDSLKLAVGRAKGASAGAPIAYWQERPKLTQPLRPKQKRWQNLNQTHRCVQCHHRTKEPFAQQFAPTVSGNPCSKIREVHTKICFDFGMNSAVGTWQNGVPIGTQN